MINAWNGQNCQSIYMREIDHIETGENGLLAICLRDGSTLQADHVSF